MFKSKGKIQSSKTHLHTKVLIKFMLAEPPLEKHEIIIGQTAMD